MGYTRKADGIRGGIGAVAGLVAITPASGYVGPLASIVIGGVAGFLCFSACNLKTKLGYDDSLDVVGFMVWEVPGGALATGLFAHQGINAAGADGLFYGNPGSSGISSSASSPLQHWDS